MSDAARMVAEAKARPCRCGGDHTFGEHVDDMIAEEVGVLNRLEPHLGCVLCGGPVDAETGRCEAVCRE